MHRTGVAELPLHPGRAPRWLFTRMVALARGIAGVMVEEKGPVELLLRLSDPFWFQSLSCVLGFDWHSSGTTTVTCGALKEALKDGQLGIVATGGKGAASRKTPGEIAGWSRRFDTDGARLEYSSRMAAKVDSAAVQSGHPLYHHAFFFDESGDWSVVQQGLHPERGTARRYHWCSSSVVSFVEEPHSAILGAVQSSTVLDMTARASEQCRKVSVEIANDGPTHLRGMVLEVGPGQSTLHDFGDAGPRFLKMPRDINWDAMRAIYERQPQNYEALLAVPGAGPATVRALALISELLYGEPPSWRDPVRYSFAVGGKDGVPFPVDRRAMDEAAAFLRDGVERARVGDRERMRALQRLGALLPLKESKS